jgi:hypothetical protein
LYAIGAPLRNYLVSEAGLKPFPPSLTVVFLSPFTLHIEGEKISQKTINSSINVDHFIRDEIFNVAGTNRIRTGT